MKTNISVVKLIGMLLVAWGHLVGTGTWAYQIPGVIAGDMEHPIIPSSEHQMWRLEQIVYDATHVQFAVVGVVIFFILSGYLLVKGQEKYPHAKFFSLSFFRGKIFRIFPGLILCVGINSIVVYITQHIVYLPQEYLATATLTFGFSGYQSTMGVLWYLQVLFCFYLMFSLIQRFDIKNILTAYGFIFGLIFFAQYTQNHYLLTAAWLFRYVAFILIGVTYGICENEDFKHRVLYTLSSLVITYSIIKEYQFMFGDDSTYTNIYTSLFACAIVVLILSFTNEHTRFYNVFKKPIHFMAEISFEFYLVHVHIGLSLMYSLSNLGLNPYWNLLAGFVVSILVAKAVHIGSSKLSKKLQATFVIVKN